MIETESTETVLTHWEGLVDAPEQVWRWVAAPGYLVAETPWQVLRIEPEGWDQTFGRLLNQELGVPQGWTLEWEPGACVVSRIAHVGPSLDGLLLEGSISRWAVDFLTAQIERGFSIAFRGGGRSCRWVARALGAQWPLAYETRGRGLSLDPRLLVWEGERLPASADVIILSAEELENLKMPGVPLIIDQIGRKVPREVSALVDVRKDGRIIRVQERQGRNWVTLFRNETTANIEALEPVSVPFDEEYWHALGQADWWQSMREVLGADILADERHVARDMPVQPRPQSSDTEVTIPAPVVEPLPQAVPMTVDDLEIDQGWEVAGESGDGECVMTGDDAVLEASLGLGPPPAPAGQSVQRDPALSALLNAIRKDIDG